MTFLSKKQKSAKYSNGLLLILIVVWIQGCSTEDRFARIKSNYEREYAQYCSTIMQESSAPIPKNKIMRCYACLRTTTNELNRITAPQENLLLKNQINELFNSVENKKLYLVSLRRDPSVYNLGGWIKQTLSDERSPISYRLDKINELLINASDYYAAAKDNLYNPLPGKCRLGAQKQLLTLELLSGALRDSIQQAPLKAANKTNMLNHLDAAKLAVKDYLAYCESLWFEHQDSTLH